MERRPNSSSAVGVQEVDGSIIQQGSFEAAFEEHFPAIHRFLARRLGGELADDLAAETFAVAYRRRASYDPSRGDVRPWLFGIATVLLRAHRRGEQELLALEAKLAGELRNPAFETELAAFVPTLAPRLAGALAQLSAERRDVLLLHAWGELSCEEIAAALRLRAVTVRSRLSRARRQLRDTLASFEPTALDLEGRRASSTTPEAGSRPSSAAPETGGKPVLKRCQT